MRTRILIRLAGEEGFEPSLPGPEPDVLPLDYSPVLVMTSATDVIESGGAYAPLQSKSSPLAGLVNGILPSIVATATPQKAAKIRQLIQSLFSVAGPHLTTDQVRPPIFSPHLNGVQVVAGSNPAAPTFTVDSRQRYSNIRRFLNETTPRHSNSSPQPIFPCPHYYFHHSSLVVAPLSVRGRVYTALYNYVYAVDDRGEEVIS